MSSRAEYDEGQARKRRNSSSSGNIDKEEQDKGGLGSILKKYSSFSGMRSLVHETQANDFTEEEVEALRVQLHTFITTDSKIFSDLVKAEEYIRVDVFETADDCIRFTVTPFFKRIDISRAVQMNREFKRYLPGFTFVPAHQGNNRRQLQLIPSSPSSQPFIVSTHVESSCSVIEFRRTTALQDRPVLFIITAILSLALALYLWSFYTIYAEQGYSLMVGITEMFNVVTGKN